MLSYVAPYEQHWAITPRYFTAMFRRKAWSLDRKSCVDDFGLRYAMFVQFWNFCWKFRSIWNGFCLTGNPFVGNPLVAIIWIACLFVQPFLFLLNWHVSGARPSCTGTPARVWMRWSSRRLSPTWTTWSQSISSIRMLLLKRRASLTKRKESMMDETIQSMILHWSIEHTLPWHCFVMPALPCPYSEAEDCVSPFGGVCSN